MKIWKLIRRLAPILWWLLRRFLFRNNPGTIKSKGSQPMTPMQFIIELVKVFDGFNEGIEAGKPLPVFEMVLAFLPVVQQYVDEQRAKALESKAPAAG